MIGTEKTLAKREKNSVHKLLSNRNSFAGAIRGCEPTPGVRLRFRKDGQELDMLLCFECSEAVVVANGKVSGHLYFDPIFSRLAKLAISQFPTDRELRDAIRSNRP